MVVLVVGVGRLILSIVGAKGVRKVYHEEEDKIKNEEGVRDFTKRLRDFMSIWGSHQD